MILRGIDFGHVANASGARGFFGEGYWFHRFLQPFGLDWEGSTFVAKTTTFGSRPGYMPMKKDGITPREWFPSCIKVNPWHGGVLNAVGLSGPGLERLLDMDIWQEYPKPFYLSVMAVAKDRLERIEQYRRIKKTLKVAFKRFRSKIALQINISCPNVHMCLEELVLEADTALTIFANLRTPLVVKINALVSVMAAWKIMQHPACDALCVSNTIPYGELPHLIPWAKIWGRKGSPLAHLGGGGYSGPECVLIVSDWIGQGRDLGMHKPIIACCGIRSCADVDRVLDAGANAIELGSLSTVRGWRVKEIIQHVNNRFAVANSLGGSSPLVAVASN